MQRSFNQRIYRYLFLAAVITLATGTVVYHFVEKFTWIDAYYFSVVTLATVGFGDLTPHTTFGKIFTTFYILIGVGIIAAFVNALVKKRAAKIRKKHK